MTHIECRRCGATLPVGTVICPECGTRQRARPARVRCRYCGRRASVELTVCPHCGRDLKPAGFPWRRLGLALVILGLAWGIYMGRNLITEETFLPAKRLLAALLRPLPTLVAIITPTPTEPPPTPTATPTGVSPTPTATPSATATRTASPTLVVSATASLTVTAAISGTVAPTATVQAATPAPTGTRTTAIRYKVQPGENLTVIAQRFGVTVEAIVAANGLRDPERLQVGQELIIPPPGATPAPTATPTRRPTPRPTPTPTPALVYPAPALKEPAEGEVFSGGKDAVIILSWEGVGPLASDEWYAVRLRYVANGQTQYTGANVKETSWRVPADLFGKADQPDRVYQWDVTVIRVGPDGAGQEVSPHSPTRSFRWP